MDVLEDRQFHDFIRKKRSEVQSLSECAGALETYISNLERDISVAKFKKRAAIQKKIAVAKKRLVYVTSGEAEKEFETKIAPFANEFSRRMRERSKTQKRRRDETHSRVPQSKKRREFVMNMEANVMSDHGIAAFVRGEEDDPGVVVDELKIELKDDDACMYLNPHDMCEDCDVPMELVLSHPILICPMLPRDTHFLGCDIGIPLALEKMWSSRDSTTRG